MLGIEFFTIPFIKSVLSLIYKATSKGLNLGSKVISEARNDTSEVLHAVSSGAFNLTAVMEDAMSKAWV